MTARARRASDDTNADVGQAALRNWLRLLDCSTLVENELRRRLHAQFHTTLPRFDVLAQLDRARRERVPGLTMSELSRRLMVTNGNLTALVERLAQEKLIRRATSPTDKRMSIVSLTPAGKRTLDAMTPAHRKWIVGMFGGLSPEERDQLYALLGKLRVSIHDSLSEPYAAHQGGPYASHQGGPYASHQGGPYAAQHASPEDA